MITTKDVFDPDHDRPDAIGRSGGHDTGENNLRKAYPIPYGALVPKYLDGVLCCTRAIGVEPPFALDAHRGITPTIVVGQAAGTAAALAASNNIEPRDVDVQELRRILRENDVVLDVETIKLDNRIPEDKSKWVWKPRKVEWQEGTRKVEWQYGERIEKIGTHSKKSGPPFLG